MKEWLYKKLCQIRDKKQHNVYKLRWEKERWQQAVRKMKEAEEKSRVIEGIAADVIDVLNEQGLTRAVCTDLEKHAYSVNDSIQDAGLRNMHILAAGA